MRASDVLGWAVAGLVSVLLVTVLVVATHRGDVFTPKVWLFLTAAGLLGLIPAFVGRAKGQSFGGWWLFGALLFVVALPMVLLEKPRPASA